MSGVRPELLAGEPPREFVQHRPGCPTALGYALLLSAFPALTSDRNEDPHQPFGWAMSDEVWHMARSFGYDVTLPGVASDLARLLREDCPVVERHRPYGLSVFPWSYRLTRWGQTLIGNRMAWRPR